MADDEPPARYMIDQEVQDRIAAVGGVIAGDGDDLMVHMVAMTPGISMSILIMSSSDGA